LLAGSLAWAYGWAMERLGQWIADLHVVAEKPFDPIRIAPSPGKIIDEAGEVGHLAARGIAGS